MSFTHRGQQRRGSSLTSKRAPTRRRLIACPPSIQGACHTPAISFCPTCTFLSKLPVRQRVMDSSQSFGHNGVNASTQESRGARKKKNTVFHSAVCNICTRPKQCVRQGDVKVSPNKVKENFFLQDNKKFEKRKKIGYTLNNF